jgi:hypothetical protein
VDELKESGMTKKIFLIALIIPVSVLFTQGKERNSRDNDQEKVVETSAHPTWKK